MKHTFFTILATLICLFGVIDSNGQSKGQFVKISGFIKDSNVKVVDQVEFILDDNIKHKVLPNKLGYYKLKIPKETKNIKVFSFSRGVAEVQYRGQKKVNFFFNKSVKAPAIVKSSREDSFEYKNIFEMIRAKVPGVTVGSNNRILIRGTTSLQGSIEPLLVVNGAPVSSIDNISPQFVKRISVLKGPECAIYGVRGSNGVVLITLKNEI